MLLRNDQQNLIHALMRKKTNSKILTLEIISIVIVIVFAVFLGNNLGKLVSYMENTSSSIDNLENIAFYDLPTTLYDINGEKITQFFLYKREIVKIHRLPKKLIEIFIAIEDSNFYRHIGIDLYSVVRALKNNITASVVNKQWTIVEGGSTITQQISKLLFTKGERTLERKSKELWKALQIEKRYSKSEIIEKYLNQIYFGHGIYGVGTASVFFFNKRAKDLNVAESALLVSMTSSPNKYSPIRNPKKAKVRHRTLLNKIVALDIYSKEQADEEYEELWHKMSKDVLNTNKISALNYRVDKAPYFSEYIRLKLESVLKQELQNIIETAIKKDYPSKSQEDIEKQIDKTIRTLLFTGGFKVYTTLDLKKQKIAQRLIKQRLKKQDYIFYKENNKLYSRIRHKYTKQLQFIGLNLFTNANFDFSQQQKQKRLIKKIDSNIKTLSFIANSFSLGSIEKLMIKHKTIVEEQELSMKTEAALIAIEPKTGYIKTMVGGRRFSKNNRLNRVFSKRQPGSAFKVFVYGAAFKSKRFNPNSILKDEPVSVYNKLTKKTWTPRNHNDKFLGEVSLRKALTLSINTISVKLVKLLGAKAIIDFAAPLLGVKKESFEENISIALGTKEITPFQMCKAMATLANKGKSIKPTALLRITDRYGNTIKDFAKEQRKKQKRLITKRLAYVMTTLLEDVINKGTGRAARTIGGLKESAAGKTGTTQNSKDVWFAGFTPSLATVVWLGFDRGLTLGKRQFGGNVAAPLWGTFMREAGAIDEEQAFK